MPPLFETKFKLSRSWCIRYCNLFNGNVPIECNLLCTGINSWYLLWCLPSGMPSFMWQIHAMSGTWTLTAKHPEVSVQYLIFIYWNCAALCVDWKSQYLDWRQSNYTAKFLDPLRMAHFHKDILYAYLELRVTWLWRYSTAKGLYRSFC